MDKKDKQKKIFKVSGLIGLFLLVFGLSYALFTVTLNGTKKVKVKTGKLELQLLDENNNDITDTNNAGYVINLDNQVPVNDEIGLGTEAFTFKLKNIGTIDAKYTIYLDDVALEAGEERMADEHIKYSLTKNNSSDYVKNLNSIGTNPNRNLDSGVLKRSETNIYTLKIWIDEDATNEAMNKVFNAALRIEGVQYKSIFTNAPFAEDIYSKDLVGEYDSTGVPIKLFDNDEEGLYKYTDESSTITYAYSGKTLNNYVLFADQLWRIVRIQSDGSVKLIRDSGLTYQNSTYDSGIYSTLGITNIKYNKQNDNDDYSKYHGSNIESYINAWYEDTMTSYDSKIATNDYCSDRTEVPLQTASLFIENIENYSKVYGVFGRYDFGDYDISGDKYYDSVTGEYDSDQEEKDSKTVRIKLTMSCREQDKVNAKAALITEDEYLFAGIDGNYIRNDYHYWTMSPESFSTSGARVFVVTSHVGANSDSVDYKHAGILPVITLKPSNFHIGGDGTSTNPYVIG